MGVVFTKEQQQVIDLRNCNILVSAAAGSGKTAVLVERIIQRLTKDDPLLDVDQLLIVTFTEAAASEMKERVHAAIEKALEEQPDNVHLQRQATLIHQAQITTMHTFCLSVIKEYFHTIDLDPGFRVAEPGEIALLKHDIIETVLEEAYENADPEFLEFVESFASGKDDHVLEEMILQMHEYADSYPNPNTWLDTCVKQYEVASPEELEKTSFVREILEESKKVFHDVKEQIESAIQICKSEEGPIAYVTALQSDLECLDELTYSHSFSEINNKLENVKWATLGRHKKGVVVLEEKIEQVKFIRDEMKKSIKNIREQYFIGSIEELHQDLKHAGKHVKVLVNLVQTFETAFSQEKRKKNMIDFGDMEHYALAILTREVNGELVPSEVAETYQKKFVEVMIDEYQDSNFLQEAIMTSVSGVSKGRYNMFMVGDVKQSIYSFRLSRPELFMDKFHTYRIGSGSQQRIDLHKNFRSRKEVLDSTNFVFEQIMIPSLGGISYDEKAALYVGADYEKRPGNETEVLLLDMPDSRSAERMELEAEMIASKIRNLKAHHTILDKKTGTYRPVRYSDIVILTRSPKGWNEIFERVLTETGIPTYTGSKEGYFQTLEIQLVLNYLKILDNPRQDIPLTSVLTSVFARITTEELASIRTHSKETSMYESVLAYLQTGTNHMVQNKLTEFIKLYEELRQKVPYTPIHTLLWQLLEKSGYGDYVAALPGGEQRAANLEMLVEKAIAFEGTSYKGLFNFVRYIEQLEKYEVDYGEANIIDENAEAVALMSIHKSKGLEMPIVFVAGLGKEFNTQDMKKSMQFNTDLGVGIDCIDDVMRTKRPTLLKKAITQKIKKDTLAEELRVLYVAMTRAKEKLILTGAASNLNKRYQNMTALQQHREMQLPYNSLMQAKDFLDWILMALCRNYKESFIQVKTMSAVDVLHEIVTEQHFSAVTKDMLQQWDTKYTRDAQICKQIEEQFAYEYAYKNEQSMKQKLSVSELKKQIFADEEGEELFHEEEVIPLLPKFLQEDSELTGASRGTAYHKLLELLDFGKEYDEETLKAEILALQSNGYFTKEMASCIRVKDILQFLQSNIGRRMQKAKRAGTLVAEQPFVLGVDAKTIYPEIDSKEVILVQGIIDVYFEEEDGLVVLDYKTDRVNSAEELTSRYRAQLAYYAEALERLTGKPVKEKKIYSFALHKEIEV